nr:hypothetical protein GTC16762_28960 [Pigmentibacter ruber]
MKAKFKPLFFLSLLSISLDSQARIEKNDPRPAPFNMQAFLRQCEFNKNIAVNHLEQLMLNPNHPSFVDRQGKFFYYWSLRMQTFQELKQVVVSQPCGFTAEELKDNIDAMIEVVNEQTKKINQHSIINIW